MSRNMTVLLLLLLDFRQRARFIAPIFLPFYWICDILKYTFRFNRFKEIF